MCQRLLALPFRPQSAPSKVAGSKRGVRLKPLGNDGFTGVPADSTLLRVESRLWSPARNGESEREKTDHGRRIGGILLSEKSLLRQGPCNGQLADHPFGQSFRPTPGHLNLYRLLRPPACRHHALRSLGSDGTKCRSGTGHPCPGSQRITSHTRPGSGLGAVCRSRSGHSP